MINPTPRERITPKTIVLIAVLCEGGLLALAWLLGLLFDEHPLWRMSFTGSAVLWGLAAVAPMALFLVWVEASAWRPLREMKHLLHEWVAPMFAGCSWFDLAVISLLAGLGEEALFRGVIQTPLAEKFGPVVGVAVASVAFGLAHAISRVYVITATLIGVYLGILMLYCDNLLAPILAHALYDFIALAYLVGKLKCHHNRGAEQEPPRLDDGRNGDNASELEREVASAGDDDLW